MVTNIMVKKNIRQYFAQIPIPDYGKSLIKHTPNEIQKQVRFMRNRIFLTYASPALAGSALAIAGAAAIWSNNLLHHDLPSTSDVSLPSSQAETDTSMPPPHVDLPVYLSDTLRPSHTTDMLHLRIIKELDIPEECRYFIDWREKAYLFQAEIIHTFYTAKSHPSFPFPENGMIIDCVVFGDAEAAIVRETEECFALIINHKDVQDCWTETEPQRKLLYQISASDVGFMPVSEGKLLLKDNPMISWKDAMLDPYLWESGCPYLPERDDVFLADGEDIASVYEKLSWLYEEYYPNEDLSKRKTYDCFRLEPQ